MKSTLTILFLFLFCPVVWAQSRVTTKLPQDHNLTGEMAPYNSGFGVKGGLNYSTLAGDATSDIVGGIEAKPSYHAGFFAQFRLSDKFSLQPELLYSRRGYRGNSKGGQGEAKAKFYPPGAQKIRRNYYLCGTRTRSVSSAGSERYLDRVEVTGSNPVHFTTFPTPSD